jgi:hypothetical protein
MFKHVQGTEVISDVILEHKTEVIKFHKQLHTKFSTYKHLAKRSGAGQTSAPYEPTFLSMWSADNFQLAYLHVIISTKILT